MAIKISVDVNLDPIRRQFDKLDTDTGRRRMAMAAARGMSPYVPMRTGQLMRDATPGVGEVTYPPRYAEVVFVPTRPMTIHKDKHPKATSRWDKAYQAAGAPEACEEAVRIIEGK